MDVIRWAHTIGHNQLKLCNEAISMSFFIVDFCIHYDQNIDPAIPTVEII